MMFDTELSLKEKIETSVPKMYSVIFHNDDITTQNFVVDILVFIFDMNINDAVDTMKDVHNNGMGIAGTYTYDIANSKKIKADDLSMEYGYPLKITVEEAME